MFVQFNWRILCPCNLSRCLRPAGFVRPIPKATDRQHQDFEGTPDYASINGKGLRVVTALQACVALRQCLSAWFLPCDEQGQRKVLHASYVCVCVCVCACSCSTEQSLSGTV